ncbi:hypothetical protein WA538_002717, partial [Blastocystis sp. DL]
MGFLLYSLFYFLLGCLTAVFTHYPRSLRYSASNEGEIQQMMPLVTSVSTEPPESHHVVDPLYVEEIPQQFHFDEYRELDRHLTERFGLPFTYKRLRPEVYHYVPYGYNYTYLAEPVDFCASKPYMVVMIMSTVKKPEEREVLRRTWFQDKTVNGKKIKYLFIVSSSPDPEVNRKIDEEAKQYNDILHMDHLDSYNNITMSIMNTFNWLHRNCHSIRYILKGDPDSYFNMPKIVDWLERLPPERQKRLYHGSCFITSFFIRKPGYKWDTPYAVDKEDLTWPYCVGVGYVISADLLAPLVLASRHYPYMLRTEDMSIGLAALMLNVTPYRYHDYYWTPPEKGHYGHIDKCKWKNYFDFHKIPLNEVETIHSVFNGSAVK